MSVILQAPYPSLETSSILPNPDFSDVESPNHSLTIKRSMNGTKRTYVQTAERHLLTYSFTITRGKSLEVEAFIKAYKASMLKMINHKDEIWIVRFGTNPFELNGAGRALGVPGGEYQTVTLNFEGSKQ